MMLACMFSLMGVLQSAPAVEGPRPVVPREATVTSAGADVASTLAAAVASHWPISGVVRMFGVMALATLALSGATGMTAVSLLVGARFGMARSNRWLGTDVLLGLSGLTGMAAVILLLVASGSSVVCALWWLAEVSTST